MVTNNSTVMDQVAIIGGGPAGLATARALKVVGIPCVIYEKHSDFGGIWDIKNPGSPMYRSAHFISSKTTSGHEHFSMPTSYPDYPSNRQILQFIREFAKCFDLYEAARFNTVVEAVVKSDDGWSVSSSCGGESKTEFFRWVVCASGTNWFPNIPKLQGEESFTGEIIHSVNYHEADFLRDKKVVVVGAGNSGVDIACDAAFMAEQSYASFRRGYHFVPKHVFGIPTDVFASGSSWMPMWLSQLILGGLLRLLTGDLTRLGLQKPDHKILESHPIMNSQILHYLQHGDLIAKPDIRELDGNEVVFKDGSRIEVDLIILATGYRWNFPYLKQDLFDFKHQRPLSFMKIFNPSYPTIFLNGFIETNSSAYKLFDEMAMLIAQTIKAQASDPERAAEIKKYINGREPDLSGHVKYVDSQRHSGYANVDAYIKAMRSMRKTFDWPSPTEYYSQLKAANESDETAKMSMGIL